MKPPEAPKLPEPGELLEALPEPALIMGSEAVLGANAAARALLGGSESAPLPEGDWARLSRDCFRPVRGRPGLVESRGLPRRLFEPDLRPIPPDGSAVLVLLREVSDQPGRNGDRQKVEEARLREWEELRRRAEQAERIKAELTANVTHDLRTPLASIKASVSGLLAGDVDYDPRTLRETLQVIEEETDRLQRRVANLLSMARMDAGGVVEARDWVDLSDVAAAAVEGLQSLRGSREILLEIPEELPLLWGSYDQLVIAVRNLIENALLYSPPDQPVEVSVSQGLGSARVRVRDYGPGLMPDEAERVFDRFYRGRTARRIPGSGLGLPICRGIAEEHGGRLWAEHEAGGGVAFVLSLPLPDGSASPDTKGQTNL